MRIARFSQKAVSLSRSDAGSIGHVADAASVGSHHGLRSHLNERLSLEYPGDPDTAVAAIL